MSRVQIPFVNPRFMGKAQTERLSKALNRASQLPQPNFDMKFFFYDVETTGTDKAKHAIHQLAAIIVVPGQDPIELNYRMRPIAGVHSYTPDALAVSGVTVEELLEYPPMDEAFRDLVSRLDCLCNRFDKQDKFFQVGYNCAGFDSEFLRKLWTDHGDNYFGSYFWPNTLDVYVLATAELMDRRAEMPNFKLHTVAKALGFEVDESKLHDAFYDVRLTKQMFERLMSWRESRNKAVQLAMAL